MRGQKDPVDTALNLLRSDPWTAAPYSTELENRLMQETNTTSTTTRFGKSRILAVGLALLAVGGVTFATTGGVDTLKGWLLKINVDGETAEIQLDEFGEGTLTMETEDGGTARIFVQQTPTDGECDMTRVEVFKTIGDEDGAAMPPLPEMPMLEYTLADLGDAEPVSQWTDAEGLTYEMYVLPTEDAGGSRLFLVAPGEGGAEEVMFLTALPFDLLAGDGTPEFTMDDDGLMTLTFTDADGGTRVIKTQIVREGAGGVLPHPINCDMPDGAIEINIEVVEEEIEVIVEES